MAISNHEAMLFFDLVHLNDFFIPKMSSFNTCFVIHVIILFKDKCAIFM